jgi:ABC-type phosphate/phosphonate transport system ATPase subunit
VLTSHDPRAALGEADLILGLKDGRAVFIGPPDQLDPRGVEELYA